MEEKNRVPGPVRSMYAVYVSALVLVLYSGFCRFHPFVSGWRYPWSMELMNLFNFVMGWVLVLTAVIYLYYALVVRPGDWKEPLGVFRITIAALTVPFFLVLFATCQPWGWLKGLVNLVGGPIRMFKIYELALWFMLLLNVIYIYARWASSERFPRLFAVKKSE
ncbi:MAG: hypothetical protein V1748_07180 [Actinomycetota bacterium]